MTTAPSAPTAARSTAASAAGSAAHDTPESADPADAADSADGPEIAEQSGTRALRAARRQVERAEMRRFTRGGRHRRAVRFSVLAVVLVLIASVAVAVYSPIFAIREVQVVGAERVDPASIQAALEPQLGTPLALLDAGEIREALEGFPLIESYVTESALPNTLVIRIVERSPIAVVPGDAGFQVVDAAGVTIETHAEVPAGYPLIELDADGLEGESFRASVRVLRAVSPELAARIETVTATTVDDVTFQLRDSPQRVIWGSADQTELKALVLEAMIAQHAPTTAVEFDVSSPSSPIYRMLG